jgi:hypothetical protein
LSRPAASALTIFARISRDSSVRPLLSASQASLRVSNTRRKMTPSPSLPPYPASFRRQGITASRPLAGRSVGLVSEPPGEGT